MRGRGPVQPPSPVKLRPSLAQVSEVTVQEDPKP